MRILIKKNQLMSKPSKKRERESQIVRRTKLSIQVHLRFLDLSWKERLPKKRNIALASRWISRIS